MPDPMTEIVDADFDRLDLVKNAANGAFFLIAKAEKTTASMNDAPDSDFAYVEPGGKKDDQGKTVPRSLRHFYIADAAHVRDALSRAPQSPFGEKAMPKIEAAAKKFGIDQNDTVKKAGDELASDVPVTEEVMEGADTSADARDVLQGQAIDATGDPDDPRSPAWEAVDAALGRRMVDAVTALKQMLARAAQREATEAVSDAGGDDDCDNACDLDDAQSALDFLLSVLAPFAATEQAEADARESRLGELAKSATQLAAIVKAGRVLSAANEQALREAAASIEKVLASLPAAQPEESAVTKSEQTTTEPAAATDTTEVAKAGSPQVAVYDASGKLVGTVDPADLNPIAAPEPPAGGDAQGGDDNAADDTAAAPTEEAAPAAEPADLTPVPPDAAGTPADDTGVAKSADNADRVPDTAELHALVKSLQGEIEQLKAPARSKVLTNGALPPAHQMRGQDRPDPGAPARVDGDELRKELAEAATPAQREEIAGRMNAAAIEQLSALRNPPRR